MKPISIARTAKYISTRKPTFESISCHFRSATACFAILIATIVLCTQSALALSPQDVRLLCSGLGSKLAVDDDASFSVDSSGLRASKANGTLSVYEGDKLILEVEDFSYKQYTDCVLKLLNSGQQSTKKDCEFPLDPRAASFNPRPAKNVFGKPIKGFTKLPTLGDLVSEGRTDEALMYGKRALESSMLVSGPFAQLTYESADRYASLLNNYGATPDQGRDLTLLQNRYGQDIGSHSCLQ